jgi:hypothetical protein
MDCPDPTNIECAEVTGRQTVKVGDRVRHSGQRFTGAATATITGFSVDPSMHDTDHPGRSWVKIHVVQDQQRGMWPKDEWDWDRTVLVTSRSQ